jgi:hypothetical protein
MTWAALLPRRNSASPALIFRCFPARVQKKVAKNKSTSGVRPDRITDFVQAPVQKVIRKQIMLPHTAPPTVAAPNLRAIKANATLNTKTSSTKTGNRMPNLAAARSASAHNHTSNAPTTPTSIRDCNPSRASGIAFRHPVSLSTPSISSAITQPYPPQ